MSIAIRGIGSILIALSLCGCASVSDFQGNAMPDTPKGFGTIVNAVKCDLEDFLEEHRGKYRTADDAFKLTMDKGTVAVLDIKATIDHTKDFNIGINVFPFALGAGFQPTYDHSTDKTVVDEIKITLNQKIQPHDSIISECRNRSQEEKDASVQVLQLKKTLDNFYNEEEVKIINGGNRATLGVWSLNWQVKVTDGVSATGSNGSKISILKALIDQNLPVGGSASEAVTYSIQLDLTGPGKSNVK